MTPITRPIEEHALLGDTYTPPLAPMPMPKQRLEREARSGLGAWLAAMLAR